MSGKPKVQIRSPSSAVVADFVAQGDTRPNALTSQPVNKSTKQPKATTSRKGVVSRVRKGDLDRVTAYLPVELGAELRMHCAGKRIELSEAIADAVRAWLAKD